MRILVGWLFLVVMPTSVAVAFFPQQQPDAPLDLRTPADMVLLASQDIVKVLPDRQKYIRYLDLSTTLIDSREMTFKVMGGHMQHLSRSPEIVMPGLVKDTAGSLLRIDLEAYGIDLKTWEQLAEVDPYYHIQAKVEKYYWPPEPTVKNRWRTENGVKYYMDEKGQYHKAGWWTRRVTEKSVLAPWLVPTAEHKTAMELLTKYCYTNVPIVRGDWFFNQTAAQHNRAPGYYDFLGVNNKADFERKIIGFDRKLFRGFSIEARTAVGQSAVATSGVRGVVAELASRAPYTYTIDFKNPKDKDHPLKTLGRDLDDTNFDAFEGIGLRANGFPAFYASDKQGKFQDIVPADIAGDKLSKSNDLNIHPNISCMRCHSGSIQKVDDWFANMPGFQFNVLIDPYSGKKFDYKKIVELRQQHKQNIEALLITRKQVFDRACVEIGFKDSAEYSKQYALFWEAYEDIKVDIAFVERSVGVPKKKILYALQKAIDYNRGDTILSALLIPGRRFRIRDFEQNYHVLWEYLQSYPMKEN